MGLGGCGLSGVDHYDERRQEKTIPRFRFESRPPRGGGGRSQTLACWLTGRRLGKNFAMLMMGLVAIR
jgi:hypothetical protein